MPAEGIGVVRAEPRLQRGSGRFLEEGSSLAILLGV